MSLLVKQTEDLLNTEAKFKGDVCTWWEFLTKWIGYLFSLSVVERSADSGLANTEQNQKRESICYHCVQFCLKGFAANVP